MSDKFGLERQSRINKSGIRKIFTPSKPIQELDLFMGREKEVESILAYLTTPGEHALLYGDRGVGKSSLANIITTLIIKKLHEDVFVKRCGESDTLITILSKPLKHCKIQTSIKEKKIVHQQKGEAGGNAVFLKGIVASTRTTEEIHAGSYLNITPPIAAEILSKTTGVLVIDELDRVDSSEIKKISEMIKLLSDCGSPFKILLVGIAHTSSDLIGGHGSVLRCLKQTKLERMQDFELEKIIASGERKSSIRFTNVTKHRIVQLSSGFPHFTQLLSLKSAEEAIGRMSQKVTNEHLIIAISQAAKDVEEALRSQYDCAIRTSSVDTARKILVALANLPGPEFQSKQIRDAIQNIFGNPCNPGSFSHNMSKLTSENGDSILRRLRKGVFRFNDPRMPSYIRMANYDYFEKYYKEINANKASYYRKTITLNNNEY